MEESITGRNRLVFNNPPKWLRQEQWGHRGRAPRTEGSCQKPGGARKASFWVQRKHALPTPQFWLSNLQNSEEIVSSHSVCGPWWLNDKESTCNAEAAGDAGSIPGWGRAPEGGRGNPLQCPCLENPMDTEASWAIVHRVTKNWIRLK